MNSTAYRFSLAKDLKEWIDINKKEPWGDLAWSDERNWSYEYLWEAKFLPFMNIYSSDIEIFSKYFPDMDIWLKNIHWNEIFVNAKNLLDQILSQWYEGNTLSIVHLFPLEMVIVGETLKKLWWVNTAYNFNRVPTVNSISKTLEAGLFLVSWKHIDWLKNPMEHLVQEMGEKYKSRSLDTHFFLFDENDTTPNWNIARVDSYVKWAIGFKESIVTYHTEEFPSKEFLMKNGFKYIKLYDADTSNSIDSYYKWVLWKTFSLENIKLTLNTISTIWYYEEYVVEKNSEYLKYRKDVLKTTQANTIKIGSGGGTEKWKKSSALSGNYDGTAEPLSLKEGMSYIGWLAILLPIFLMLEWSNGTTLINNTGKSSVSYGGSSGIRSSGGFWSSFKSSSSSSSSNSISSFWGGGFSKWGG